MFSEKTLRKYCEQVNVPFEKEMMTWNENDKNHHEFATWLPFFEDLFKNTSFQKGPSASRTAFPDLSTLPEVVHETIKACMPYYEKMYKLRMQI